MTLKNRIGSGSRGPIVSGPRRPRSSRGSASAGGSGARVVMPDNSKIPVDQLVRLTENGFGGTGFSGAQTLGKNRSYIVFPTLDTRREVSSYSRTEMLRRARWLYNNVGIAKRIVLSLSRMMGALQPSPNSPDSEWNREALAVWTALTGSRLLFERSGKFNFNSYQRFLSRRWLIDGDHLNVFARSATGNAMVVGYEAHQIRNGHWDSTKYDDDGWFDGVFRDQGNRAKKYRVIHPDGEKHTDFSAAEALLTAFWERGGQARGVTPFHAAITRMIDVRDLTGDMMAGIKRSNLVGFYLAEPDASNGLIGSDMLVGSSRVRKMYDVDGEETDDAALDAVMQLDIEQIMDTGVIPDMGGKEPRVLHDSRPHPYQMDLVKWFIREMCSSFDLTPEMVWEIASLNGNTSRLLNEDTEQVLANLRAEILQPFCARTWFAVIGTEIAEGRLREPLSGRWDDVQWMPPKAKTIDRGRDGALNLEQMKVPGLRTLAQHYGEIQEGWEDKVDQWLDEKAFILDRAREKGIPESTIFSILFPGTPGAPPTPGASDLEGSEMDEGEEPPQEPDFEEVPGDGFAERLALP